MSISQVEKIKKYLCDRYKKEPLDRLDRNKIAYELCVSVAMVGVYLKDGKLKGLRICDIAEFIVKEM